MSILEYREARQLGQKEYRTRISRGQYPYLQVLDEMLRFDETQGEEDLGLVDIPISHIVGTKTQGRTNAFASNFMPLLEEGSEFSIKWASLADSHLAEGIRDPIQAYEYMNRFYVLEGNKRVSVLKFFGAAKVPGTVRRLLPKGQDTPESKLYFEFLDFYRLTKVNTVWFSQPGRFKALAAAACGSEHPWTEEERGAFSANYARFRKAFKDVGGDKLPGTTGDAFLAFLRLHEFPELREITEQGMKEEITRSWKELAAFSLPQPVELALDPEERPKSLLTKLLTTRQDPLRAVFIYERDPETSAWTHAHDEGRRWAEEQLKGRVVTSAVANVAPEECAVAIYRGVGEGADVVFTTSPKLLPGCLKAAPAVPETKILNCSVNVPHPSIRTYYSRMFEIKFLAGLAAGAMTQTHKIGYGADYPISGAVAAINAFALGVRMTDPLGQVYVEWRSQHETGLWEALTAHGVDMVSALDLRSPVDAWQAHGLYRVAEGAGKQLATWTWNWGRFYELILKNILEGKWKQPQDREAPKAINYWWGLSAGVVDLQYTEDIPKDTRRLMAALREDIIAGRFRIFDLSPEEISRMDYLAENVVGCIPALEELSPEAQELVRLQGVRREDREGSL